MPLFGPSKSRVQLCTSLVLSTVLPGPCALPALFGSSTVLKQTTCRKCGMGPKSHAKNSSIWIDTRMSAFKFTGPASAQAAQAAQAVLIFLHLVLLGPLLGWTLLETLEEKLRKGKANDRFGLKSV